MLDWTGATAPAVFYRPPWLSSVGWDVIELAAACGLHYLRWQQLAIVELQGRTTDEPWADGSRWSSPEQGLIVARQNGKDAIIEGLSLGSLFLWNESFVHSAHQFKTAGKAFARVTQLILNNPDLEKRLKQPWRGQGITTAAGKEGIHLQDLPTRIGPAGQTSRVPGPEALFVARSGGSGRGFTVPRFFFNEAWNLTAEQVAAQTPAQATLPDPQSLYATSPPDKLIHPNAAVIGGLRDRARAGADPDLAWLEWTMDPDAEPGEDESPALPQELRDAARARRFDEAAYARANPSFPELISASYLGRQARGPMGGRAFDVEHGGIGSWPTDDEAERWEVIPRKVWKARGGAPPVLVRPELVAFGIAASWPNAELTSLGRCFRLPDQTLDGGQLVPSPHAGDLAVEVYRHEAGGGWVVDAVRLAGPSIAWVIDPASPAGYLIPDLEAAGVQLVKIGAQQVGQAFGGFYAGLVTNPDTWHYDQPALTRGVGAARTRPLGDAATWARRGQIDTSPAEAVTLARWGYTTRAHLARRADILNTIW